MDTKTLNRAADNIRILSASMVEKAKSGHPGGAMGGADFINVLYAHFLRFDPNNREWAFRDRFFLDPGHMSPMLYASLSLTGTYNMDELANFRQWKSPTPGHPEIDFKRGVENTSGPLGQGHAMAVGAAVAEKFLSHKFGSWMSHKIYTFISDGGIQEEISLGAARVAGTYGLSNLIMFYDSNNIQLSTKVDEVSTEDVQLRYEALGWRVYQIDGNDPAAIYECLEKANAETEKPVLIIGNTIMGKGAVDANGNSFEAMVSTHGQPLSAAGADYAKTIESLGGNADAPFEIFSDVQEFYAQQLKDKEAQVAEFTKEYEAWKKANPALSSTLDAFLDGSNIKQLDFSKVEQKADQASRASSATVLAFFADEVENMLVMSADLSNSDKTDGFLKKTKPITKTDFEGRFLHVGVSELTMATLANGMAIHGGVVPVCGTFFVFSDYMKPAVRLSALMELPVKYVWTHDAFRVGEDGPTHQPIEQEAQIRLLEKMKNHSGNNSMLVLRPADAEETTAAWELAMQNTNSPSGLILSRQNIKNLPNNSYQTAKQAAKGAYIVAGSDANPDVILFGNGSEVATLCGAAELLRAEKQLKIRVVSVPSEGLFRIQSATYREEVFTAGIPRFGLTAGISSNLDYFQSEQFKAFGHDVFGDSAPAGVLDEKFGYTSENIKNEVLSFLK